MLSRPLSAVCEGRLLGREGRVALIGCGPGDPELLTLKALRCIRAADVLIIDRLVNPAIAGHARPGAERICLAKTLDAPAAITRLLLRHARAGKAVARLKGGDPLIFGRAGEELAALTAAGIAVEVIPGITAAQACAARIGLPLTLRRRVRHFTIATGAGATGGPDLPAALLAREGGASAIYMGVGAAGMLRRKLLAAGCRRDTPVVIVENGTLASERAVATTLEELADCVRALGISAPAVIFLGLAWDRAGLPRPEGIGVFRRQSAFGQARARGPLAPRPAELAGAHPSLRKRSWSVP
jgi:uroporphyrin-III C-methyltransferase